MFHIVDRSLTVDTLRVVQLPEPMRIRHEAADGARQIEISKARLPSRLHLDIFYQPPHPLSFFTRVSFCLRLRKYFIPYFCLLGCLICYRQHLSLVSKRMGMMRLLP